MPSPSIGLDGKPLRASFRPPGETPPSLGRVTLFKPPKAFVEFKERERRAALAAARPRVSAETMAKYLRERADTKVGVLALCSLQVKAGQPITAEQVAARLTARLRQVDARWRERLGIESGKP